MQSQQQPPDLQDGTLQTNSQSSSPADAEAPRVKLRSALEIMEACEAEKRGTATPEHQALAARHGEEWQKAMEAWKPWAQRAFKRLLEQFNSEPLVDSKRGGPRLSPWFRVWVQSSEIAQRWSRQLQAEPEPSVDDTIDRILGDMEEEGEWRVDR
jgi:hypothetical protein